MTTAISKKWFRKDRTLMQKVFVFWYEELCAKFIFEKQHMNRVAYSALTELFLNTSFRLDPTVTCGFS